MKCFPLYLVLPQRLKGCYCLGDKCPPKTHLWKVWLSASGNYWQIRESLSNVTGSAGPLVSHGHSYLAQQQTVLLPLRWELFSISTLNGKLGPQSFPLPLVFLHPWSERLLRHELAPPPCSPAAVCSFCPVFHRRVFPLCRICSAAMCFFCRVLLQPCVPPSPHYATTGSAQRNMVMWPWGETPGIRSWSKSLILIDSSSQKNCHGDGKQRSLLSPRTISSEKRQCADMCSNFI